MTTAWVSYACRRWRRQRSSTTTFSTLFLNSTAHFQHLHWREMEPALFQVQPTPAEIEEYRSSASSGRSLNFPTARTACITAASSWPASGKAEVSDVAG